DRERAGQGLLRRPLGRRLMFIDASAIIAIIGGDADGLSMAARLAQARNVFVSPVAINDAVAGLARKRACPIKEAISLVDAFVEETVAQTMDITAAIGRDAIEAFGRYGKGRHPADLNMGDCFAYACAKSRQVPLLFKGNHFVHTDIEVG
ncbi:MAG: type II toxin-antitoxin system VapC family toxin, partial [Devosia sp.]